MNPTCIQCGTLQPPLSREESVLRFKAAIGRCLYEPDPEPRTCVNCGSTELRYDKVVEVSDHPVSRRRIVFTSIDYGNEWADLFAEAAVWLWKNRDVMPFHVTAEFGSEDEADGRRLSFECIDMGPIHHRDEDFDEHPHRPTAPGIFVRTKVGREEVTE